MKKEDVLNFLKKQSENSAKSNRIKLEADKVYKLRILSNGTSDPLPFVQKTIHWVLGTAGKKMPVLCKDAPCELCLKGEKAMTQYLINVLDLDTGIMSDISLGQYDYNKVMNAITPTMLARLENADLDSVNPAWIYGGAVSGGVVLRIITKSNKGYVNLDKVTLDADDHTLTEQQKELSNNLKNLSLAYTKTPKVKPNVTELVKEKQMLKESKLEEQQPKEESKVNVQDAPETSEESGSISDLYKELL